MSKSKKTIWQVYCPKFDCKFSGRFNDRTSAEQAARKHECETKHRCSFPWEREVYPCLTHDQCLQVEQCPYCHVPFPLMIYTEPGYTKEFASWARALVEHHEEPCPTLTDGGWMDVVYACRCVEHKHHHCVPAIDACRAHRPVREKTHTQGRCYVCNAPITRAAKAYQQKLNAQVASLFPCEEIREANFSEAEPSPDQPIELCSEQIIA